MKNILFYNLWHNGDVFSGRGYIKYIINNLPNTKFGYYHKNHPKIVSDLVKTSFKPDLLKWQVELLNFNKIFETPETIYINTWVGTYFYQHADKMVDHKDVIVNRPGEGHANYRSLHRIYKFITQYLNKNHGTDIHLHDDPLLYVPQINWNAYDIGAADDFIEDGYGTKMILICNGKVRSMQSNLGNLSNCITALAKQYPLYIFICTEKFETNLHNIIFTQEIFNLENDLNEIAYLSLYCDIIVGKNSGPFMFTHVEGNINNSKKVFVALSHNVSDCYPCHIKQLPCKYLFSNTENEQQVFSLIKNAISITDGSIINLS